MDDYERLLRKHQVRRYRARHEEAKRHYLINKDEVDELFEKVCKSIGGIKDE